MARARAALDAAADSLSDRSLQLDPAGFCRLELAPLVGAPQETGLRLLARVVMAIGGQGYRPRLERLERLYAMLVSGEGAATLGGCRIAASGGEALVWRESGRGEPREMEIAPGSSALWDGRFRISVSRRLPAPVRVRPLGQEGWRAVREAGARPGLPGRVGPACISFWRGEDMVAAPHALAEGPQGGEYQAEFVGLAGMAREVR
jgi:tRNA(Ile)-lysidine synthase